MKFKAIKSLVGSLAPTLGTALGGPVGGMAANLVAEVLGCDPEPKKRLSKLYRTQHQNNS